jgi:hypothetical protein
MTRKEFENIRSEVLKAFYDGRVGYFQDICNGFSFVKDITHYVITIDGEYQSTMRNVLGYIGAPTINFSEDKEAGQEPQQDKYMQIVNELHDIYVRKNKDYGDSFHELFKDHGIIVSVIHEKEKVMRIESLAKNGKAEVSNESIIDSYKDLVNYGILTLMELSNKEQVQ